MDSKKFEINLKKINTLKQNIDLSGEDISRLEIELLKTYVKQLYEAIAEDGRTESEDRRPVREGERRRSKIEGHENGDGVVVEEVTERESKEETPVPETAPATEVREQKSYDKAVLAIFESDRSSELSDKLSSMPITDIKRAIGINDRIFTINELFGGDIDLFNTTLDKLNSMGSFDEAREYLLDNIAEKCEWSKEENQKKAKRFIKVVRRRFS